MHQNRFLQSGFSLVELTVVLVIVALLSSGLLLGLSAQRDVTSNQEVQRQLDSIKEALLAFAITNGRLPCPAFPNLPNTDANAGLEGRLDANSDCNSTLNGHGVLPWATLGLPETDTWGQRFTYFASSKFTRHVTPPALTSFSLETGLATTPPPENNSDTANIVTKIDLSKPVEIGNLKTLASDLAAVVVSHGSLGAGAYRTDGVQNGDLNGDEIENANTTLTFVSLPPSNTFNDQLIWISPNQLKSRLVAVGKLP
jgi:prepilin-type N-terminal cleavage/methylation domain-containing protein